MKFELIIPTYKRVEKLQRLINSIRGTVGDRINDILVYVLFDNNDRDGYKEVIAKDMFDGIGVVVGISEEQKCVFKIWNEHLKNIFSSDVMIAVGDDTEFINGGIIRVMETYEKTFPDTDGFVGFEQDLVIRKGGCKGAWGMIGRKFADRFPDRQCYCPEYKVQCADTEIYLFAESIKKFYFLSEPPAIRHYITEHNDETKQGARELWEKDFITLKERQAKNLTWGITYEKSY